VFDEAAEAGRAPLYWRAATATAGGVPRHPPTTGGAARHAGPPDGWRDNTGSGGNGCKIEVTEPSAGDAAILEGEGGGGCSFSRRSRRWSGGAAPTDAMIAGNTRRGASRAAVTGTRGGGTHSSSHPHRLGVRVTASAADGSPRTYTAAAAIVTLQLGVLEAGDVAFDPPLPPWKTLQIGNVGSGLLNKVALCFAAPFWTPTDEYVAQAPAASADPFIRRRRRRVRGGCGGGGGGGGACGGRAFAPPPLRSR